MTKKLLGAILSGLAIILYYAFVFFILFITGVATGDLPLFYYLLIVFFFGIPLVGVIYVTIDRVKDIKNGEEEEASKY